MRSVLSRFSEASATCLMCSGRLFRPRCAEFPAECVAELGGDHDLVAERREGFADELLVRERAIDFGGIEEGDAALDGRADQRDRILLVGGGP